MRFEWDDHKESINRKKHGITFREAMSVFYDDYALVRDDPEHSSEEDRFLILGYSYLAKIIVVSHCCRGEGSVIRIISARRATGNETLQYHERRKGIS